jgi:hypothetical protein
MADKDEIVVEEDVAVLHKVVRRQSVELDLVLAIPGESDSLFFFPNFMTKMASVECAVNPFAVISREYQVRQAFNGGG